MGLTITSLIVRKQQAMEALKLPISTFNLHVKKRLITRPISLGGRAVGWPLSEIDALIRARNAGANTDQIRELVQSLERERTSGRQLIFE